MFKKKETNIGLLLFKWNNMLISFLYIKTRSHVSQCLMQTCHITTRWLPSSFPIVNIALWGHGSGSHEQPTAIYCQYVQEDSKRCWPGFVFLKIIYIHVYDTKKFSKAYVYKHFFLLTKKGMKYWSFRIGCLFVKH